MIALQKSLMEQSDIVPTLKGFDLILQVQEDGSEQLVVLNPPTSIVMQQAKFVTE